MERYISDDYWEQLFQLWFELNRPSPAQLREHESCPKLANGDKPTQISIRDAMDRFNWHERADVLQAKAIQAIEPEMVDKRAEMFRNQLSEAREIKSLALNHLKEQGFDNSSSAVAALFKSLEVERQVAGMSEMMEKLSQMSPEQLQSRVQKLLRRKNEAIEAEVVEEDAESNPTPD